MLNLMPKVLLPLLFCSLVGCKGPEEKMLDLMEAIANTAEAEQGDCARQARVLTVFLDDREDDITKARTARAGSSDEERAALEQQYGAQRKELIERTIRAMRPCARDPRLASALRRL